MPYASEPSSLNLPWVDSPFLPGLLERSSLDEGQRAMVRAFAHDGFWIVEEPVEDLELLDRIAAELQGRYTDSATGYDGGGRILDAWRSNANVARLASTPRILDTLRVLYGRRPVPFQTLNFEVGSQQRAHSDVIHFDSIPYGFMCGVWVALEDVDLGSGPLFYYPGSHRLPRFDLHDIGLPTGFGSYRAYENFAEELLAASGLARRELCIRKGQALIWAANLFHGGSAIRDASRTRLSQVTHYYFDDCLYYQPMASDPSVGRLALKAVMDIGTGRSVPNLYRGRPVNARRLRPRKSLAQWVAAARRRLAPTRHVEPRRHRREGGRPPRWNLARRKREGLGS